MKTRFILLFIVMIGQPGFSQDWDLFIPDQYSYYKQQHEHNIGVELFLLDSVLKRGKAEILHFNAKSNHKAECYSAMEQYLFQQGFLPISEMKIDSLVKTGDSVLFISKYGFSVIDTFIFKPQSHQYDAWQTNGISIECTELGLMEILGEQDSIKIFECSGSPFDGIEFILSKSHGLIKFVPLNEFIYHNTSSNLLPYFELIGYSRKDMKKGYVQPEFSDYFHLHAGDVLFWKNYSENLEEMTTTKNYYTDSITASFLSDDSVHYQYTRKYYDSDAKVSSIHDLQSNYTQNKEGQIVSSQSSWFQLVYSYDKQLEALFINPLAIEDNGSDTITILEYVTIGTMIDTSNCEINQMVDYDAQVRYSTREGIIFRGSGTWGTYTSTVIGSIIDDVRYGITTIPLIIKVYEANEISAFPNPASDEFIVATEQEYQGALLQVYSIDGRLVSKHPISGEENKIPISDLENGIYILRILHNNHTLFQEKIVIEHK